VGASTYTQVYNSAKKVQQPSLWFAPASAVKKDTTPLFCNNAICNFAEEKELVQPYWTKLLASFPDNTVSEIFDGHETATLGSLKPCITIHEAAFNIRFASVPSWKAPFSILFDRYWRTQRCSREGT
jgi:hypothetical protein